MCYTVETGCFHTRDSVNAKLTIAITKKLKFLRNYAKGIHVVFVKIDVSNIQVCTDIPSHISRKNGVPIVLGSRKNSFLGKDKILI